MTPSSTTTGAHWRGTATSVLTIQQERSLPIEIYNDSEIHAVAFSPDGKYLVAGDDDGIEVWRVEDGKQMSRMKTGLVHCLALSKDGRWIAAGTSSGVTVWDAESYKQVSTLGHDYAVVADFSPDSTRLAIASFSTCTTTIWDTIHCRRVLRTLRHGDRRVIATKYSPKGDRIATATHQFVLVWESNNGRLLTNIPVEVVPDYNNGLLWYNNHLLVVSYDTIKKFDTSTGSALSEYPIPNSIGYSCISLMGSACGESVAYSTSCAVVFCHPSTHTQHALIHHPQKLFFIALSSDGQSLAISGRDGKIIIKPLSCADEPDIQIDVAVLDSWQHDQLANAEALLIKSRNPSHHVLASRALVRVRLQKWDAALVDAEMAINTQPSVIGYIAKSMAFVGKGEKHKAHQACDIALEYFHSSHGNFLLLTKAIVMFMAGEQREAIQRIDDLISVWRFSSICYVVQAYMYLLLGKSQMECNNYEDAIQSFELARAQIRGHPSRLFLVVSLISGWRFDNLDITIRQRLCEALYFVGRTWDAKELLLKIVDEVAHMNEYITGWISDLASKCLLTVEADGNSNRSARANTHDHVPILCATLNSSGLTPLLEVWVRTTLVGGSWRDALVSATRFVIPRTMVYRAICKCLEANGGVSEAGECLLQMVKELLARGNTHDEQTEWALGKLESFGDAAMSADQLGDAISHYSAALALDPAAPEDLLIKRSKAYIGAGLLQAALDDANKVIELDPLSPWGHERKYAALHKAIECENAVAAFEPHLPSTDRDIRGEAIDIIPKSISCPCPPAYRCHGASSSRDKGRVGISLRESRLQPRSDSIREMPRPAPKLETTLDEDSTSRFLGVFSMCLPVVYDGGDEALGRLLAQLITRSGDTSFLAWTGKSGSVNSCLPVNVSVFNELQPPHIPPDITGAEMETITAGLHTILPNLAPVTKLYDRLSRLRAPSFSGKRMILPCIVFKLGSLSVHRSRSERVFHAQTDLLGIVEIRAKEDLSQLGPLCLVHPWIDFLLGRQYVGSAFKGDTDARSSMSELPSLSDPLTSLLAPQSRTAWPASCFCQSLGMQTSLPLRDTASLQIPPSPLQRDKQLETRALQCVTRLGQPFGALLLTRIDNVPVHRRVATESLITAQVQEVTPATLNRLAYSVRVLDVL